jgi:sulfur relay (sulfurtransferase) complex TusBCD TusD component (DsrE family)
MTSQKVFVFSRDGFGSTDLAALRHALARKFLSLLLIENQLPAQICFYTDGVRLCLDDSPVLAELKELESRGVELVICLTCLEALGVRDRVAVGVIGGMGDILAALQAADSVVTV